MAESILVVHEISPQGCVDDDWLEHARVTWGKWSIHLDIFALPAAELIKITHLECWHVIAGIEGDPREILETADCLYSGARTGEAYSVGTAAARAALALKDGENK